MWSIIAVEITLQHNQVTIVNDLSSPGQYMPLAAGVANSAAVLYALLKKSLVSHIMPSAWLLMTRIQGRQTRRRPSDVEIGAHSAASNSTVSPPDLSPDNDYTTLPDGAANDQLSQVATLRPALLH